MYGVQETVAQADRVTVGFEHDAVERVADQKDWKRNVPRQLHRFENPPADQAVTVDAVYFRYAPSAWKSRISERPHASSSAALAAMSFSA